MKKICFAIVLSVVSVFSISAQTDNQTAVNRTATENLKIEKVESEIPLAKTETVVKDDPTTAVKLPAAAASTEQKPPVPAIENQKPEVKEVKPSPTPAAAIEKAQIETVKTENNKESETPLPAATPETVKQTEEPILPVNKFSLGTLSTGNAAVDGYIEEFSAQYNVDPLLIYAQMSQESSFKARATSAKGASGFMQLMPATAARFGVTNVYNPKQNIKAGVKYMRWLLDKFGGDMRLALAGYNAGEGAVMKYGNKIPPYRETQNYVAKIMNHYELISNQDSTLAQNEAADK